MWWNPTRHDSKYEVLQIELVKYCLCSQYYILEWMKYRNWIIYKMLTLNIIESHLQYDANHRDSNRKNIDYNFFFFKWSLLCIRAYVIEFFPNLINHIVLMLALCSVVIKYSKIFKFSKYILIGR